MPSRGYSYTEKVDAASCFGAMAPPPTLDLPYSATSTVADLKLALDGGGTVLVDVREAVQYSMCALPGSVSLPLREMLARPELAFERLSAARIGREDSPVFVLCRRGNDSRRATQELLDRGLDARNVNGGLESWRKDVDPAFPSY